MSIKASSVSGGMTVLLTGGRAPCTLELARALHAAGHRVLVAESARYHLCRVSRAVERNFRVPAPNEDKEAFLAAVETIVVDERVDVFIPTCEEIFYVAYGLVRLGRHCKVWAAPLEQLGELHDKWRFVRLAARLGLSVPPSTLIQTREQWLAYAGGEQLDEEIVMKPAYSRFASRVLFVDKACTSPGKQRRLAEVLSALSPAAPWLAQRRIYGRHLCTYSLAYEGELVAHTAYPCRYRVGQGATVYFEPTEHEGALRWVRTLVQAIGFTGQIAFDFIEAEDGELYALECNPRATSGIHLFGADGRLAQAFLQPDALRDAGRMLVPEQASRSMLTAAMLAAGWSGNGGFGGWLKAIASARDVVFSRKDMKPAFEQLRVLLELWRTGRRHGISLAEAATIDMEWNGDA